MSRFANELMRRIEESLQNLWLPAQRIVGQISGSQVATGSSGSPGVVDPADFEPALGNPGVSGYVLSSTTAGARSWVAQSGGGGGSLTIQEVDGSPSVSGATKLILPNGTLSASGTEATYTPTTGAPTDAEYLTAAASGGLSAEVVIPGLAGSADIAGAGGASFAEEYDSTTTGLTWTPSTPATVDSDTTAKSHLYVASTDSTERFGYRSWAPGSGAFDARCKISLGSPAGGSRGSTGLVIASSDTNTRAELLLFADAVASTGWGDVPVFVAVPYSYSGGYSAKSGRWATFSAAYLRIARDGSNNISWYASGDGLIWHLLYTMSFSITVDKVGFRSADNPHVFAVDWLRAS